MNVKPFPIRVEKESYVRILSDLINVFVNQDSKELRGNVWILMSALKKSVYAPTSAITHLALTCALAPMDII